MSVLYVRWYHVSGGIELHAAAVARAQPRSYRLSGAVQLRVPVRHNVRVFSSK